MPPVWRVLATKVPPEQGRARFHDVSLWNISATGATRAFEVDGYRDVPLRRFSLKDVAIQAREGGWLYDVADWRFEAARLTLDMPIDMEQGDAVHGLPAGAAIVRPRQPKADPSQKSYEEQDKS